MLHLAPKNDGSIPDLTRETDMDRAQIFRGYANLHPLRMSVDINHDDQVSCLSAAVELEPGLELSGFRRKKTSILNFEIDDVIDIRRRCRESIEEDGSWSGKTSPG